MLNDDGDDLEEEERMKRKREEQIEKEREERLKHLNEWKVTYSQRVCIIYITIICCFAFNFSGFVRSVQNHKKRAKILRETAQTAFLC